MNIFQENTGWSWQEKFSFRFAFVLFPAFVFFYINIAGSVFLSDLQYYPSQVFLPFLNWSGKYILSYPPLKIVTTGRGDTAYDYQLILTIILFSLFCSIIWTLIDRKRKNYYPLYYWLNVILRYYVAITLFQYGIYKIIKTQFPFPGLDTLINTYGNSSPMNLAWTFFGYSKGYNLLIGITEAAGLLLLYRRTVTVGALISLVTTVNIMAINYFYDVPVKILSTALFLMCLFVLMPNFSQLWNFFVLNRPSGLIVFSHYIKNKQVLHSLAGFKILLIAVVIISAVAEVKNRERLVGDNAPKAPLYGIYEVETFVLNNDTLPPLTIDNIRWKQLVINWKGNARITLMNGSSYYSSFDVDTSKKQVIFGHQTNNLLHYTIPDKNQLMLYGRLDEDSIAVYLNKTDLSGFKLINRGFHWITEQPFNQ